MSCIVIIITNGELLDGLVGVAVVGSIAAVLTAGAIILGKALSKK